MRFVAAGIVGVTTVVATRTFMAIEQTSSVRWLVIGILGAALVEIILAKRYLLAIATYAVLVSYWLFFVVANGGLPLFIAAAVSMLLCGGAVWLSQLTTKPSDIVLVVAVIGSGFVTSSFVPASLIVVTTAAIIPFALSLPLILTKEQCTNLQYLGLLAIILLAGWSVTSSAILFT